MPLDLQGTVAGVGDTIEARKLAWDLIGYQGNRHGPVTREQYRVLATRDDGGLLVAPILGGGPAGEQLGEQMALPGSTSPPTGAEVADLCRRAAAAL